VEGLGEKRLSNGTEIREGCHADSIISAFVNTMKALLKFTTSLVLVAAKSCEGAIGLGVTRTTGTAMGFADINLRKQIPVLFSIKMRYR